MHWTLAALLGLLAGIGVALAPIHPPTAGAAAPGLTIRLSQSSTESRVGQTVLLTAVVEATVPGQQGAQTGWAIEFSGTANGGWTSGITTTAGGEVSYLHRGEITGSDTITASIVNSGCGGVTSNAVVHDWWQPQITLSPTDSVSTFGATATVTANLHRDNAAPLRGQRLTFTVQQVDFSSGQFSETVTTDANGNASISWQRPSATDVVEAIRVAETDQAEPARAGGSHVWDQPIDQTLQIDLSQPSPDSQVGTDLAVTATARIGGAPAANRQLLMYSTETGGLISQQTNADGVAVFHKTATTAGPDNLLFYFRSVQGSVSILHQWWTAPTIAADSDDVAGFVGRVRAPTATASYAGRPVQGRSITLQVSGASTISQTTTTDARGRASFDGWTRSSAGFDNVAVGPVQSSMSWIPAQAPPIAVALRQIGPVVLHSRRAGHPLGNRHLDRSHRHSGLVRLGCDAACRSLRLRAGHRDLGRRWHRRPRGQARCARPAGRVRHARPARLRADQLRPAQRDLGTARGDLPGRRLRRPGRYAGVGLRTAQRRRASAPG